MNSKVTVYLVRVPQYADRMRKYKVFLDGTQVGEIKQDETLKIEVDPGEHKIYLQIDWAKSNTLLFKASIEKDIYLECGNNVGTNMMKVLVALTVARNTYLYVKRTQ